MNQEYFYGKPIHPDDEQERIELILTEYKDIPVGEKLLEQVHARLMEERFLGNISIPFTIEIKKDPSKLRPDCLEINLETKV